MTRDSTEYGMYDDLAPWWPLISPPEGYIDDAAQVAALLRSASIVVHEVLELGSGGGHIAVHLTPDYIMTLVDHSVPMLTMSRRLNPACEHRQGDMRTVRLGRRFDAVVIHDAIDYMITERSEERRVGKEGQGRDGGWELDSTRDDDARG